MASIEQLLAGPTKWTTIDSQTNATATATKAAVTGRCHYITGLTISANAAPAAAIEATLYDGTTAIDLFEIPASAFAPIVVNYKPPIKVTSGAATSIALGAGGAGVKTSVTLRGFTASD